MDGQIRFAKRYVWAECFSCTEQNQFSKISGYLWTNDPGAQLLTDRKIACFLYISGVHFNEQKISGFFVLVISVASNS